MYLASSYECECRISYIFAVSIIPADILAVWGYMLVKPHGNGTPLEDFFNTKYLCACMPSHGDSDQGGARVERTQPS